MRSSHHRRDKAQLLCRARAATTLDQSHGPPQSSASRTSPRQWASLAIPSHRILPDPGSRNHLPHVRAHQQPANDSSCFRQLQHLRDRAGNGGHRRGQPWPGSTDLAQRGLFQRPQTSMSRGASLTFCTGSNAKSSQASSHTPGTRRKSRYKWLEPAAKSMSFSVSASKSFERPGHGLVKEFRLEEKPQCC